MSLKDINLNLKDVGWIMVVVPLVFQLAFAFIFTSIQSDVEDRIMEVSRAREFMYLMQSISIKEQELFLSVHQFAVSQDPDQLETYNELRSEMTALLRRARAVSTKDRKVAAEFRRATNRTDEFMERLEQFRRLTVQNLENNITPQNTHLGKFFTGAYDYIDDIQKFAKSFDEHYRKTQVESLAVIERETDQSIFLLWFFMILYVAFTILLAVAFTRGTSQRFSQLLDNTRSRMANAGTGKPLGGKDELALLNQMLTTMADSAEEASMKVVALVENATDVLCSISADGKIISINKTVEDSWGYEKEELINRSWTAVLPEKDEATGRDYLDSSKQTGQTTFDLPVVRSDGTTADMLWNVSYLPDEGSFVCVIHDNTETRRAERKIEESERETTAIISALPLGVATIDAEGGITSCNPALTEMFELGTESSDFRASRSQNQADICQDQADRSSQSRNLASLLPGFGEGSMELNSLLRREPGDALEVTIPRKGREPLTVELALSRIRSADDLSYLATLRDVSERHRLDQLRRELLAIASHDLRTPLTTVSGTLALLVEGVYGKIPENYQSAVRRSESEINLLTELTNDLLDIEKLESGAGCFELEPESIVDTIRDAELSLRSDLEERGIKVEFETDENTQVNVDGERLYMAIQTLVRNAARRSGSNGRIKIGTRIDGDCIFVDITDFGKTLSEEEQNRLFDRMKSYDSSQESSESSPATSDSSQIQPAQRDEEDAPQTEESRLKLPVTKAIIEAFNGKIGVESTTDSGTRFWIRLPIHNQ